MRPRHKRQRTAFLLEGHKGAVRCGIRVLLQPYVSAANCLVPGIRGKPALEAAGESPFLEHLWLQRPRVLQQDALSVESLIPQVRRACFASSYGEEEKAGQ